MNGSNADERPRINHVAVTVPRDLLDEAGRGEIVEFYGEVFGWREIDQMTTDGQQLVLAMHGWTEFVFLIGSDEPSRYSSADHFGVQTDTLEQFESIRATLERRQRDDDRIVIEEEEPSDFGAVTLHSFYVRHLLPLKVEVQHYVFA